MTSPLSSNRSTRLLPMNPAAPVTKVVKMMPLAVRRYHTTATVGAPATGRSRGRASQCLIQARDRASTLDSERKSCCRSVVVEHFHGVQRVIAKILADE